MSKIIGVRFRSGGKAYFFSPGEREIRKDMHVVVETSRGVEYGTVVMSPMEAEDIGFTKPVKEILRIATAQDDAQNLSNRDKEAKAFEVCQEKISAHQLEMKLIDVEYTFDNNKVLFYFTADGRIDFRELVKDLASVFRTRIELRQIGVRDETKIRGGIGICGRVLCCHSYLDDFIPVSIKMAKEQNLSLNPTKISGVCGRLMCCLKNEEEVYEEINRRMPGIGDLVQAEDGVKGEVSAVNVLREMVKILVDVNDEKEVHEYKLEQLTLLRKKVKHRGGKGNGGDQKQQETSEAGVPEKKPAQEKKRPAQDGERAAAADASAQNEASTRRERGEQRKNTRKNGRRRDRRKEDDKRDEGKGQQRNAGKERRGQEPPRNSGGNGE